MLRTANSDASQRNGGPTVHERRKAKRYQLSAPVFFSWERSDGKLQACEGVTRDICMRGIFVMAADVPEVGAYIELDAYMPAVSERGRTMRGRTVKLHGEGRVLRVEAELRAGRGFAAEVFFQSEPQSSDTVLGPLRTQ